MSLRTLLVFAFGACCIVSVAHEKAIRTLLH
jgi:hypothetical protein